MAIAVVGHKYEPVSYLNIIANVFLILLLGMYLLLLFATYTKSVGYFVIAIAVYIIIFNLYYLLHISTIKDPVILKTLNHRIITFMCIYNVFLSIILMMAALFLKPAGSALTNSTSV